ncbi:M23 family metallopeptidase [uncultured Thermanaerothrix sp.]|uniref:LysM peptidoglycan-binding domain-containing M23 family metallopeptidase n=1 Tax=uncultured Thermanaerothrix sp. TaxID=1195149 RepID=UPI002638DF58|nr:M23 family metallopeptidase [uncultured Thermanaerothrix sp.]
MHPLPDKTDLADADINGANAPKSSTSNRLSPDWWDRLTQMGLGELTLRVASGLASLVLILIVIALMGNLSTQVTMPAGGAAAQAAALPTATPTVAMPPFTLPEPAAAITGVVRHAQLKTLLPSRPRFEITQYEVQKGDTIFGIAEKFGLKPETILWGNYETLFDNPHFLQPGQVLNILPTDGLLYTWHEGDSLNKVAEFFKVKPEDIVNWPGNHLDAATLGDYSRPNIQAGTRIFVPGGRREFVTWSAPRITRQNPGVAKIMGPGACGVITEGAVGTGSFIWPTPSKWISGYDYSPSTNHYGIDIGGAIGVAIYAADNGVIVYAGWNDWGYGNVIVIDHGNGWQTLYAHLSQINVVCGQSVYQGDLIGLMGSTGRSSGPHLHFEMRHDVYGKVNPHDFLP